MALAETTLSAALAAGDTRATFASATGVDKDSLVLIDGERCRVLRSYTVGSTDVPLDRGLDSTAAVAHASGVRVIHGVLADWGGMAPGAPSQYMPAGRAREVLSYSAAGAITLPKPGADMVANIVGTNALAMTLASPTKEMDYSKITIISSGKAAHTVAPAAALNNAGSNFDTAITFAAGGLQVVELIAVDEFWCIVPSVAAGTLTNVTVTYS